jgi:hypothetical protein
MIPNTGSTVCLRSRYLAFAEAVASFSFIFFIHGKVGSFTGFSGRTGRKSCKRS